MLKYMVVLQRIYIVCEICEKWEFLRDISH